MRRAGRRFAVAIAVLAVIGGMSLSAYMTWVSYSGGTVVGCDGELINCDHVLSSHWSKVVGIPVGLPAAGLYLTAAAALVMILTRRRTYRSFAWSALLLAGTAAALAAVWFIGLQIFVIEKLCPYCFGAHLCGLTLLASVAYLHPAPGSVLGKLLPIAFVGVAGLVLTQWFTPPEPTFQIVPSVPVTVDDAAAGDSASGADAKSTFDAPAEFGAPATFDAPDQSTPPTTFEAPVEFDPPATFDAPPAPPGSQPETPATSSTQASTGFSPASWLALLTPLRSVAWTMVPVPLQTDATTEAPEKRLIPVSGGRRQIDVSQWPLWGKTDAKYIVAQMFDYTCSHCQKTHAAIRDADQRLPGGLAVVALPTPLHRDCNPAAKSADPSKRDRCELAKLAIAVWLADRDAFSGYHNWLLSQTRSAAAARAEAQRLVGVEVLDQLLARPTPGAYVDKNVFLYREAGAGILPKIVFPKSTLDGEISSGQTLAGIIRQKLDN